LCMPLKQLHFAPNPLPVVKSAPYPQDKVDQRTLGLYVAVVCCFGGLSNQLLLLGHKVCFVKPQQSRRSQKWPQQRIDVQGSLYAPSLIIRHQCVTTGVDSKARSGKRYVFNIFCLRITLCACITSRMRLYTITTPSTICSLTTTEFHTSPANPTNKLRCLLGSIDAKVDAQTGHRPKPFHVSHN
jgi:hypothetical protein